MRMLVGMGLAATPALPLPAVADTVAELVAEVSQASVTAHIAALEGERSTAPAQAAAAAYIAGQLAGWGYLVTTQPVGASENLIATLEGGVHPDQVFVLGAHFDTVSGSPGADDNASGVAAVLEVARVLVSQPLDSTVHLLFFALEEVGILGSAAYAAALAAADVDVVGMISLDLIGYTCATPGCQMLIPDIPGCLDSQVESTVGDFIGLAANTASIPLMDAFLANAAAYVPALAIETVTVAGTGTCFPATRRSDHKSFWDEGYPALVLSDGAEARNPNYHQPSDTLSTLDLPFATDVTRAVLAHVAATAMVSAPAVPALPGGAAAIAALALALAALPRLRLRPSPARAPLAPPAGAAPRGRSRRARPRAGPASRPRARRA
jgi:acetylornithine deacetylase/succinyl-diaminopimelate desuccinylase-like protein